MQQTAAMGDITPEAGSEEEDYGEFEEDDEFS